MSASTPAAAYQGVEVSSADINQIVDDGDVILVVGPSQNKIQVTSHFLKHVSPVFQAMLNAPMSEGKALEESRDGSPIEIILPEDDAEAMYRVMRILYGADIKMMSMKAAKHVAIIAEKYGMVERLEVFASYWLRSTYKWSTADASANIFDALVVACILKIDWAFFSISKAMVKTKSSLLKYAASLDDKHLDLGMRLGMAIEELRNAYMSQSGTKKLERGLCLHCFSRATDSFVLRHTKCTIPGYHFPIPPTPPPPLSLATAP